MNGLNHSPRPNEVPEASLRRLPIYYRCLQEMGIAGVAQVSCADLARALGLDPTQVRKDIEMTGIVGKPRVGYLLPDLVRWIENFLGWNRPKEAVLAGAGSLGSALLGHDNFRNHGLEIIGVFDIDPDKIGWRIHGREVQPIGFLPDFVAHRHTSLGLIATPAAAAQTVADLMVTAGIRAIWNFAPVRIQVSPRIILQNEDLYNSLASLSFKLERGMRVPKAEKGISYAEED